ncbi:thiamine biosynthesis lipoprotein ApbE [Altererythrobacter sp. B11]|uniref:FAD:protein FMN transferase n=1 Tax=Altererythrobacter sp. B11 TaxID=2060312 RepID=UPI000DC6E0F3|nr:FAD:protein FMN transferase [Altererythrobacter sp. B11]BBC72351.1 thiamine biosynthesis lipoprotein ApbE [Altererythrobacter sp. B11]
MNAQSGPFGETGEVAELLLPPDIAPDSIRPVPAGRMLTMGGETMGTGWRLSAVAPKGLDEPRIRTSLDGVFQAVIRQMSQWEPDSELSRFNRGAPGSTHPISPQFRIVLDQAMKIARMSDGAFDPALGDASELWGFGASPAPTVPPAESGGNSAPRWQAITFSAAQELFQPGGLRLDLSGIAKGFAVDMALAQLRRSGVENALLEIGGELGAIGLREDGMPWWVDVETPPGSDAPHARIGLTGWSVATSGHYHRRREAGGESWSHTLDPESGRPIGDQILAVTVLDRLCMAADALATAIMVLGPDAGMMFAEWNDIPARIVTAEATHTTTRWRSWLN